MSNTIIPVVFLETLVGGGSIGFAASRPKGARGYGVEAFGDPYGAGGPLSVAHAMAIGGQTVRVAFNEEPAHFSAGSPVDALNPKNWLVGIVSGQATAPLVVGVKAAGPGPLAGARAGEWAIDLKLDRPLASGIRYRVVARKILSRAGLGLGFPYGAEFMGATAQVDARPLPRRTDMADLGTDPATGGWRFEGGDVAVDGGLDSYRKRVIRRATTPKGAYSFFGDDYGTLLALKRPLSLASVGPLKADLVEQIKREPETQAVSVRAEYIPLPGILKLRIHAQARQGSLVTGLEATQAGLIVVE